MSRVAELAIEREQAKAEERLPLKLNIGGGDPKDDHYVDREGYTLVDRSVGKEAYPLDYPDNSVDEIYSCHVLEHFPYEKVQDVVDDWVRALKPGGVLKLSVPNFAFFAGQYGKQSDINLQGFVMGGHTDENDYHNALFDHDTLKEILARAGLQRLGRWNPEIRDCAAITFNNQLVSCNWMGFKPMGEMKTLPDVQAVLSCPRFGPTLHFRCIVNACGGLQIYTTFIQGCYWWMQICEAMEEALDKGAKYVLTLDYDSIFSKDEIMELYNLMETYPEADAICGLQSRRGDDNTVLVGMEEEQRKNATRLMFSGNITQVATGHFGLTMFRASSLKSQPRPWMMATPDDNGSWNRDTDAVHPDIDFWYRWKEHGKSLYVANKVMVGHMVEHIMWPSKDFTPIYQDLPDYTSHGIPPEAIR